MEALFGEELDSRQIYTLIAQYLVTYGFQILGALIITEILFQARYQAHAEIFRALRDNHIEIPLPQREVRMLQDSAT